MHFYDALKFILTMHAGAKVARKEWNKFNEFDHHERRFICKGYENGKYRIHYKYIATDYEKEQLYIPSQEDMIADDWYIMEN